MAVPVIDETSGNRRNLGNSATTFRGGPAAIRGWEASRSRASAGRVYVEFLLLAF